MAKKCTFCGQNGHTQFYCQKKPRSQILRRSFTPARRKPLRSIGKYTQKWLDTRAEWIADNGSENHLCHYCGYLLSIIKDLLDSEVARLLTLDHLDARSRRPSLRFKFDNLIPACPLCNRKKGSLSHDEYNHVCQTPLPVV